MNVIDLFCGCGGLSLGFQNAGFTIDIGIDNWKPAVNVYNDNFTHQAIKSDLNDNKILQQLLKNNYKMIIGGPPCQDFSIAGPRVNAGNRANLTIVFCDIVRQIKPEWVVMENVYNIKNHSIFPEILKKFAETNYGVTHLVLDASFLGVPQARKRFFLIAKQNENDDFLKDELLKKLSKDKLTVRQYFGDKLGTEYYYMHPRSYKRRAIFSIDEPSSTIRGVNRPIPKNYKKHPADKIHPCNLVRALSTKERSLIQTFPEWFKFNGTKTQMEQVIGNAVPVKMAEYVANSIMDFIKK